MNTPADEIRIAGLELRSCIGVTEAERATPQRLTVSLVLLPSHGFDGLQDDVARTVNYSAVCKLVRSLAGARPRRLIETFALEIADAVLAQFACASVEVELRKYVLPDTEHVAVRLVRRRP
jgi:dihydroneopterin aldolase